MSNFKHQEIIADFLLYLNKKSNEYILKGGNSLVSCYGLDRMSQDIDLDSSNKSLIKTIIESYCKEKGYSYRIAKDTDTTKRYMLNYGDEGNPLKIEISYRNRRIDKNDCCKINNINVYKIDKIASMKANAYLSRDKIRDLYDVVFICNYYWNSLSPNVQNQIIDGFNYKGLEQFDYLISNQEEKEIDFDKLASDFLDIYEKIGLVITEEEQEIASSFKKSEYDD